MFACVQYFLLQWENNVNKHDLGRNIVRIFTFILASILIFVLSPAVQAQNNVFVTPNGGTSSSQSEGGDSSLYIKHSKDSRRGTPVFTGRNSGAGNSTLYNRPSVGQNSRAARAARLTPSQEEIHALVRASQAKNLARIERENALKQRKIEREQAARERTRAARRAQLEAEHAKLVAAERAANLAKAAALAGQPFVAGSEGQEQVLAGESAAPVKAKKQVYRGNVKSFTPRPVFNPYDN